MLHTVWYDMPIVQNSRMFHEKQNEYEMAKGMGQS